MRSEAHLFSNTANSQVGNALDILDLDSGVIADVYNPLLGSGQTNTPGILDPNPYFDSIPQEGYPYPSQAPPGLSPPHLPSRDSRAMSDADNNGNDNYIRSCQ